MFGVFQRGPERAKGGRCIPPRLLSDADGAPRGRCPTAVADGPGDGQRLPAVRFGFRRPAQRGQGLRSVPEGVGLTLGMVESAGDVQGGGGIREAAVGFAEEDQAMPARGSAASPSSSGRRNPRRGWRPGAASPCPVGCHRRGRWPSLWRRGSLRYRRESPSCSNVLSASAARRRDLLGLRKVHVDDRCHLEAVRCGPGIGHRVGAHFDQRELDQFRCPQQIVGCPMPRSPVPRECGLARARQRTSSARCAGLPVPR